MLVEAAEELSEFQQVDIEAGKRVKFEVRKINRERK